MGLRKQNKKLVIAIPAWPKCRWEFERNAARELATVRGITAHHGYVLQYELDVADWARTGDARHWWRYIIQTAVRSRLRRYIKGLIG